MAAGKKRGGPEKPQEDRILARLVDDSTQVTTGLTSYTGLLGRSPKEGYWLLYATLDMSLSVEIREEDIVHSERLPPDKSPFGSLGGTQVFVRKDAKVTTTRTSHAHTKQEPDETSLISIFGWAADPFALNVTSPRRLASSTVWETGAVAVQRLSLVRAAIPASRRVLLAEATAWMPQL